MVQTLTDSHLDGEPLYSMLNAGVFLRRQPASRLEADIGLQLAVLLHDDNSGGGNAGFALMGGPFLSLLYGTPRFKIGPRVSGGFYTEGGDTSGFGVTLEPIVARVKLRF